MSVSISSDVRDAEDDSEASRFDSEAHLGYFQEVFYFYDLSFQSWVKFLVCDNVSVNKKMSRIYRKPFVGCYIYWLNMKAKAMVELDIAQNGIFSSVHLTMKSARKSNNSTILCNITGYKSVLLSATRWSAKRRVLDRFVLLH